MEREGTAGEFVCVCLCVCVCVRRSNKLPNMAGVYVCVWLKIAFFRPHNWYHLMSKKSINKLNNLRETVVRVPYVHLKSD